MTRKAPAVLLRGSTPLHALKEWLRHNAKQPGGAQCPTCEQHVQVYRRKVNSGMARSLIAMFTVGGTNWVHVPTQIGARSREEGKLAYWGLVVEERTLRPDGGRAGYWRVTESGKQFVLQLKNIPEYAIVYNGRVLGFDGPSVSITDALGKKFNYDDLMAGR